ncbi:MAG TPA: quercetin 2,3-dioxygenase [Gemmatimonadaceae bacterium]|nr:quercetin 2,3-dioxygenase [Gemmatimonadaceae bacterium]
MQEGTMVMEESASAARAVVLGPGEGTPVWFLGNLMVLKATTQSTNGGYGLLESLIRPGASPPLHVHHREDETFWVLEGEVTIRCGDEIFHAPAGSYVFLPRGVPHTFRVEGETPARMLTLLTPGGGEMFFVEGGRPAEQPTLPPPGRPDLAHLERVAHAFGSEFVGPPLPPATGAPAEG